LRRRKENNWSGKRIWRKITNYEKWRMLKDGDF